MIIAMPIPVMAKMKSRAVHRPKEEDCSLRPAPENVNLRLQTSSMNPSNRRWGS